MKNITAADLVRLFSSQSVKKNASDEIADRASLKRKRLRLEKDWNVDGLTGREKQAVKRAVSNVLRKGKTYNPEKSKVTDTDRLLLIREMRPSVVLDGLFPERLSKGYWQKLPDRNESTEDVQIDLEGFSFIENPQKTLDGLRRIAAAEARCLGVRLNFKDEYCLDVVPFMILVECWKEMVPIFEGGEMDLPMQKVLAAIGVEYALNVRFGGVSDFEDVWAFPLSRRRKAGSTMSKTPYVDVPTRDIATSRFCEAMDEWLGRPEIGLELSESGREKLMNLLGEVLENAERHSDGLRRDGSWSVSGFLARRKRADGKGWSYRASIGIVSVGDSFSESLQRALKDQQDNIENYIRNVRGAGAKQSDETLRTLAAIQDGVTCVREAD